MTIVKMGEVGGRKNKDAEMCPLKPKTTVDHDTMESYFTHKAHIKETTTLANRETPFFFYSFKKNEFRLQ